MPAYLRSSCFEAPKRFWDDVLFTTRAVQLSGTIPAALVVLVRVGLGWALGFKQPVFACADSS
jgi:hypothetical protein